MCKLNDVGTTLATINGVTAMTDVTGFGLLGHLLEMCEGSNLQAQLHAHTVPILESVKEYLSLGCIPGGTLRNFESYGRKITPLNDEFKHLFCDPQTSGGLLIAVEPNAQTETENALIAAGIKPVVIGELSPFHGGPIIEVVS